MNRGFFSRFGEAVDRGAALTGLPDGAAARVLAMLAADGPVLVVTPEHTEAENLADTARFYLADDGPPVLPYPADDVPPFEGLSPHPEIPRARVAALDALRRCAPCVVFAPARALLQRVPPPAQLSDAPILKPGDVIEPRALAATLTDLGYLSVGRVEDPGTFAARGELVDAWPPGLDAPVRLEFFDDEIEQIRTIDPRSQRSRDTLSEVRLLPNREEVLSAEAVSRLSAWLSERVGELGFGQRRRRRIVEDLRAGIRFAGCEDYLPGLCELVTPLSYLALHERTRVVVVGQPAEAMEKFQARARSRWEALDEATRPLVRPEHRWASAEETLAALSGAAHISPVGVDDALDFGCRDNKKLALQSGELAVSAGVLGGWLAEGWRVGLVVESRARADRVTQLLTPHGLSAEPTDERQPERWAPGALSLVLGDLPDGFHAPDEALAVIAADEIFGHKIHVRGPGRANAGSASRFSQVAADAAIASFAHLKEGDLLVHQRHGVGRYHGLRKIDLGHGDRDMLLMEYRGGDRMYLPVEKMDQVYRFRAGADNASFRLDRLGGETWAARKQKVRDGVLKLAHELIRLEAERKTHPGVAYVGTSQRFRQFEEAFPYTETPDQQTAIDAALADLAKPEPTDRLIVGDVGFGKTEVAMRAAMRVVEEGKQVAVLAPTTVLAYQHARTFKERFAPFGVEVGLLSRFNPPAEERRVKKGLKDGTVHIALGTTSLLGRGVRYKALGLVVVDEEHRFGVKQKQKLKRLRTEVDYLAMSATPIPRTLHMALTGIREFSIIATPPMDRLPVRTMVASFSPERIREDLMRELQRGGQAFLVHNRVASIEAIANTVRSNVPEARVCVAHGQMDAATLEKSLVDFVEGRSTVLVCTSIIESGIDMPNVNTILINRADGFGLAQLYQLRGRVGRSHRRGYCTLMVDEGKTLTAQAMRRLKVLQENTELGSGFAIASADLDIRGAGDLLGQNQHGHIQAVGFETWVELLEDAIDEARGHSERDRIDPEVELGRPALLPESYVPDLEERLLYYRRLAMAREVSAIRDIVEEMEDRLGEPPPEALALGRLMEIKARCRVLGITRLNMLQIRVALQLSEHSVVSDERLTALKERYPQRFKLKSGSFTVQFTPEEGGRPFLFLHWLLGLLERP